MSLLLSLRLRWMTCLAIRINCAGLLKEKENSAWNTRYITFCCPFFGLVILVTPSFLASLAGSSKYAEGTGRWISKNSSSCQEIDILDYLFFLCRSANHWSLIIPPLLRERRRRSTLWFYLNISPFFKMHIRIHFPPSLLSHPKPNTQNIRCLKINSTLSTLSSNLLPHTYIPLVVTRARLVTEWSHLPWGYSNCWGFAEKKLCISFTSWDWTVDGSLLCIERHVISGENGYRSISFNCIRGFKAAKDKVGYHSMSILLFLSCVHVFTVYITALQEWLNEYRHFFLLEHTCVLISLWNRMRGGTNHRVPRLLGARYLGLHVSFRLNVQETPKVFSAPGLLLPSST